MYAKYSMYQLCCTFVTSCNYLYNEKDNYLCNKQKSKDAHRVQDDVTLIFLNIYFSYSYNEYICIEKYAYLFFIEKKKDNIDKIKGKKYNCRILDLTVFLNLNFMCFPQATRFSKSLCVST